MILNESILRNISQKKLKEFYTEEKIKFGHSNVYGSALNDKLESAKKNKISDFVFSQLCFYKPNMFHIFEAVIKDDFDINYIKKNKSYNTNISFYEDGTFPAEEDFLIYKTQVVPLVGNTEKIHFLIKMGYIDESKRIVFGSFTIDFTENIIKFGYHEGSVKYLEKDVVQKCKQFFFEKILSNIKVQKLNFNSIDLNKAIYNKFLTINEYVEAILNKALLKNIDNTDLNNILNKLNVPIEDKYKKQLKAIALQNLGELDTPNIPKDIYNLGYIFSFKFRHEMVTYASTRNEDYKPIYTSPIYWNLKDLISKPKEIHSIGLIYKPNKNEHIFVRLRSVNNFLEIYHYIPKTTYKGMSIDYVISDFLKFL